MSPEYIKIFLILSIMFTLALGGLIVDKSGLNLETITVNIDPGVSKLILIDNSITRVEEGDMESLLQLEELSLSFNGVNFISTRAFIKNTQLVLLHIVGHALVTLHAEMFGAWRSIKEISGSIGPANMQPIILAYLPALTKLEINSNPIHNLSLGHLPSLRRLHAQRCELTTFPDLSAAPALEIVDLYYNNFNQIPKSALVGLNQLRELFLRNCYIRYLPDLSHLVSLKILIITYNELKSLPDLYQLPLADMRWDGNPLACDEKLCWVRMWNIVRPGGLYMGKFPERRVCGAPQSRNGLRLMDIHPVDIGCYEGNRMAWQWAETLVEIRGTLADIRGTTK